MRSNLLAWVRRYRYALAAAALIVVGLAVRFALIAVGWPQSNSEEGTMGLEALHILARGEHPIYFYGQNYMGAGEAYLGALMFRLFGVSTLALRLGMLSFYAVFVVALYWLASLIYSRRIALVSLAILIFGTPVLLRFELLADGGKVETLAFGALMFALAAWLAIAPQAAPMSRTQRWMRARAYLGWGLVAGLALYTYLISAPLVVASGALLVMTCWRDLRGPTLALPLAGLLIGLLPVFIYTATMPPADNPIAVFLSLHQSRPSGGPSGLHLLLKQVEATLLYTLPIAAGMLSLFPVQTIPFYGPAGLSTAGDVIVNGGFSLAYLVLLALATYLPLRPLRKHLLLRHAARQRDGDGTRAPAGDSSNATESPFPARDAARLMLALAAWLTIAAYTASPTAALNPFSERYMIGLLVALPAVIWPLLGGMRGRGPRGNWKIVGLVAAPLLLILIGVNQVAGLVTTVQSVPAAITGNQQAAKFGDDLLSHRITQFYSDYWTCDLLTFETRERLTCGVVGLYAQPGRIRYPAYYAAVQANPRAPYVLVEGSDVEQTFVVQMAKTHRQFSVQHLDGYSIYTPVLPPA